MAEQELVVGDDGLARPAWAAYDPLLREYYDTEWGMPVRDERGLYERICLEAFQSGLSWATIDPPQWQGEQPAQQAPDHSDCANLPQDDRTDAAAGNPKHLPQGV